MLVGRAAERASLRSRVTRARRGKGNALLLSGEAGVGKTALIEDLCSRARGVTVLRAHGIESEASLGFSVLADLSRPVLGLLERIPESQAAALSGALALGPAGPVDRFATYAGALSLLATAAESSPLLVCVDDAHWMDVESAQALSFCARRIYAEPIALVLAAREGEPLAFQHEAFETLAVAGLDPADAGELLALVRGSPASPGVAAGLHLATAGNPLALIELGSMLSDAQLEGRAAIPEPLPVGSGIERLFWRRIAHQPAAVQTALLLAAASATGSVHEISRALPALGVGDGDLERAETSGLIAIAGGRVTFSHPLLRAVAYGAAAAGARRAAHRALAETVTGRDAPLRRAWHRAGGTAGPDEAVAAQLEQAGTDLAGRTGFAAAASALERAAGLSGSDQARSRRLLAAGRAAYFGGMVDRAREASMQAIEYTDNPILQADCARLRAHVEMYAGDVLEAHRLLTDAAARIASHDPVRETQLLTDAVIPLTNAAELGLAYEVAEHACQHATEVGGETERLARNALGMTLILLGDSESGYKMSLEGPEPTAPQSPSLSSQLIEQLGALAAIWVEDYERARAISDRSVSGLRAAGALTPLPYALAIRSELEFRIGRWAAALASASEAVSIATETSQRGTAAYSLVSLARVEGALGRQQAAYDHSAQALQIAAQAQTHSIRTYAGAALGLLELGLSRPDRAREHLAPLPEFTSQHGLGDPGVVCWQADWIETNIHLGKLQQAREALTRLEREGRRANRISALAAGARYRGLLAPDDQFQAHFTKALALHRRTPTPFESARTQLCFGERLRRAGERRQARDQLGQALDTFRQLGAEPWAARANSELAATGQTRSSTQREQSEGLPQELLTAQELQVALSVAGGATNKQAAAALFLSPKTIEFHLGQIYGKLGIHSRTQLARVMFSGSPRDVRSIAKATPER